EVAEQGPANGGYESEDRGVQQIRQFQSGELGERFENRDDNEPGNHSHGGSASRQLRRPHTPKGDGAPGRGKQRRSEIADRQDRWWRCPGDHEDNQTATTIVHRAIRSPRVSLSPELLVWPSAAPPVAVATPPAVTPAVAPDDIDEDAAVVANSGVRTLVPVR